MNLRALAACAALLFASPPLLGATASIPGLRASGTLVVQANVQGSPVNVGGNVALYHKGALYRLDVLSLGFPGTSGDLSALAATLIGPGGVSALYDGSTGALTAWSNGNRTYYTETPARPVQAPAPAAAAGAQAGSADPLGALGSLATVLRDVQSATIQLVGHSPVNGHPATNLDLQLKRQRPGKPLENYHAQLALADDLSEFPVQITVQSVPSASNAFGGTAKLDLTSVQADNPDDGLFVVPQGYARVDSIAGVLRRGG
ncbi:MAG TPA: hypothetical protein VGU66_14935 [Candidatus Elarobacter sp.]|nr:hypothetical protein [Candidatus Elarobacter sp.]